VSDEVSWYVPTCRCSWRGLPCRTQDDVDQEPERCPQCGGELGAEIRKGSYRTFSLNRVAGLRERRLA
jgi:hypothetical protein